VIAEQALPATEGERIDHLIEAVHQVVLEERVEQLAAVDQVDVVTGAIPKLRNRLGDVGVQELGRVPRERLGE
jgi:hypothetical protein